MDINERMEVILEKVFSGNKAAFARSIGIAPTSLANYLNKEKPSKPSSEILENILDIVPNINAYWLLSGKGEMLIDKSEIKPNDENKSHHIISVDHSDEPLTTARLMKVIEEIVEANKIHAIANDKYAEASLEREKNNGAYARIIENLSNNQVTEFEYPKKDGTNG